MPALATIKVVSLTARLVLCRKGIDEFPNYFFLPISIQLQGRQQRLESNCSVVRRILGMVLRLTEL
jgi:hypothetical protein